MEKKNICIIANVPYNSVGGRLQRLVEVLKKKNKIVWIDPPRAESYDSKPINTKISKKNVRILETPSAKNVIVKTWNKEKFNIAFVKSVFTGKIDICIVYDGWGSYLVRGYLKKMKIPVIFDYVDKMHCFSENKLKRWVHKKLINNALKKSDAVICTAKNLYEEALEYNKNSYYIPNGAPVPQIKKPIFRNKKPIVGYLGAFGSWVDFQMVENAIKKLPNVVFYFIGGGEQEEYVNSLRKYNNVYTLKPVQYDKVPLWINMFDVCIIPFKVNEITNSVSPLKLFEYWSMKKPVICTPTDEIKNISMDAPIFAKAEREFLTAIEVVTTSKRLRKIYGEKGYQLFKEKYTFDKIGEQFSDVLENTIADFEIEKLHKKCVKRADEENGVLEFIKDNDKRMKYIMKNVGSLKNKKLLDVGCGKGAMFDTFLINGVKVYGIDLKDHLFWYPERRKQVVFKVASANKIPYPARYFDYVVSSEVIEHIPNHARAIKEMVRVLKPGGKIIIIDKNKYAIYYRLFAMLYQLIKKHRTNIFKEQWFSKSAVGKILSKKCKEVKSSYLDSVFIGWVGIK